MTHKIYLGVRRKIIRDYKNGFSIVMLVAKYQLPSDIIVEILKEKGD